MKTMLGLETAFPLQVDDGRLFYSEGMNKRFYSACAAMQGILASDYRSGMTVEEIIKQAYDFADELLKQENE